MRSPPFHALHSAVLPSICAATNRNCIPTAGYMNNAADALFLPLPPFFILLTAAPASRHSRCCTTPLCYMIIHQNFTHHTASTADNSLPAIALPPAMSAHGLLPSRYLHTPPSAVSAQPAQCTPARMQSRSSCFLHRCTSPTCT
ncbi:hypothetical protein B0H14DRAFT_470087 [Mycena olivaceomarginata]|nr:hypothetical protein B0H14DRAFT_470087 [Mycena olivaceomarginata]